MERKKMIYMAALLAVVVLLSVLGPEQLARYKDRSTLNRITVEEAESGNEGYRYKLNGNEKLYLLARCLEHQVLPESELSAMTRVEASDVDYEELMGSYAFVVNRQGPSGKEITREEIFGTCDRELASLKEAGVLPDEVRKVEPSAYDAVLYSAIDVLEPQNNLAVWKVSLSTSQQNADKANRLIDAYVDADTGKIYGFYVRTETTWDKMEPEKMAESWGDYLGLTNMETYTSSNPLLETASDYVKYRISGINEGSTIVTLGFYEGINELFLKITR